MIRRHFIKQGGLLAGGLLLHNQMLKAFSSTVVGEKISVGVIGCGDRGKGVMQTITELSDEFNIVAICDVLDFRLEEAKKINPSANYKVYKEYKALLDDKNIQAVVIATPLYLHHDMAVDALKAGKQIYLEKTMAFTIPQVLD